MKDLRTEDEIIANWKGDIDKPVVSICCITYNHEPYIEDALKGFLIQETDFPFEILIHDDASTDRTADIIREYEAKYPRLIKPIYQVENQYSQGVSISPSFNYPRAKGEYIAICEGDDYWISVEKLQIQIDLMKENPGYLLSFHSGFTINNKTKEKNSVCNYSDINCFVSVEDIILKKYGQILTASTVISSKVLPDLLGFLNEKKRAVGDIYVHFFSAISGNGAIFIPEPMSVYRINIEGSWNTIVANSSSIRTEHIINRVVAYSELNLKTDGKYKASLEESSYRMYMGYLLSDSSVEDKKRTYYMLSDCFSGFRKFFILSVVNFNFMLPVLRAVKKTFRI